MSISNAMLVAGRCHENPSPEAAGRTDVVNLIQRRQCGDFTDADPMHPALHELRCMHRAGFPPAAAAAGTRRLPDGHLVWDG